MQTLESLEEYAARKKAEGTFTPKEFAEWTRINFKDLSLKHKFKVAAAIATVPGILLVGVVIGGIAAPITSGFVIGLSGIFGRNLAERNNRLLSDFTIDSNGHLFKTPEKRKLFGKIKLPSF